MSKTNSSQGLFFLILAQIMVGINIVASKSMLTFFPIISLLTIRFLLATVILLPLHWLTPARQQPFKYHFSQLNTKDWYFIIAQALSAGVLFNCLMLLGLHYTDANVAGIITSTLPAIIAIISWLVLQEKISGKKSLCIFFATIGLAVIAGDKLTHVTASHSFLGDSIVLLSLLPEAAYYVLCKLYASRLPVFLISALMNGINALLLLPFALLSGIPNITTSNAVTLVILGLSSGLFYAFWFFGCQHVDSVLASLSTAIMPIATVILAWLFLHEQLTLWQCVGMGLVIVSIGVYARR